MSSVVESYDAFDAFEDLKGIIIEFHMSLLRYVSVSLLSSRRSHLSYGTVFGVR